MSPWPRVGALRLLEIAAARQHDGALIEEGIRDGDRLVEQAARIVAEVDDIALEIRTELLLQVLDRLLQIGGGLLVEGGDADIADVVALGVVLHRVDVDHVARDLDVERILGALAHDGERDRRIDRPAHLLHRLLQGEAENLLLVEMGDEIAAHQAGARGGGILDRRDHLDDAILHRDLDAEAAEFAAGLHLHVAEMLRVEIGRMRVERGQHAVDRRLDQLGIVGLLDIVRAHALQDLAEQVELAVNLRVGGRRRLAARQAHHRRSGSEHGQHQKRPQRVFGFPHHPCTFSEASAHHGSGSTGLPSFLNST